MGKKNHLTSAELEIMEILWTAEKPMSGNDILATGKTEGWSSGYLHNVIRTMLKKGVIRVNGMVQNNTQYARMFEPALTRPEYAARMALSVGITQEQLEEVIEALKKQMEQEEKKED